MHVKSCILMFGTQTITNRDWLLAIRAFPHMMKLHWTAETALDGDKNTTVTMARSMSGHFTMLTCAIAICHWAWRIESKLHDDHASYHSSEQKTSRNVHRRFLGDVHRVFQRVVNDSIWIAFKRVLEQQMFMERFIYTFVSGFSGSASVGHLMLFSMKALIFRRTATSLSRSFGCSRSSSGLVLLSLIIWTVCLVNR